MDAIKRDVDQVVEQTFRWQAMLEPWRAQPKIEECPVP
jgi:hypothetical protein